MSKWYKNKWQDKSRLVAEGTAAALQLILDELNQGQRQKLMKNEKIAALLSRHGLI